MHNLAQEVQKNVSDALQEDIGNGDVTAFLIPADNQLEVRLLCREPAILCGKDWFEHAFHLLDENIRINWSVQDGDPLEANQTVCRFRGHARAILTAERSALNFLQTLSATATVTHRYQSLIRETGCRILDTRKTIPNLRLAQKYAVRCGGGMNHRIGLYDAFLLKENHLSACGSMSEAVHLARQSHPDLLLEVEVENLVQLQQAIDNKVDRVLLDNFNLEMLNRAVTMTNKRLKLEASGDITLDNILEVAQTGVDYISIGALTKHIKAVDFSLRFVDE